MWEQAPRLPPRWSLPGWWLLLLTSRLPAQSDLSTLEMPLPVRLSRCPWGKLSTIHSLSGQRPLWALPCGLSTSPPVARQAPKLFLFHSDRNC